MRDVNIILSEGEPLLDAREMLFCTGLRAATFMKEESAHPENMAQVARDLLVWLEAGRPDAG